MRVAVVRERAQGERRVAATPETVRKLVAAGCEVLVEQGAGEGAFFPDAAYEEAGARIVPDFAQAVREAALVLKVQAPTAQELSLLAEGTAVVALFAPHAYAHKKELLARKITAFALELIPRITRAQAMDVLSSQASIAGYKAVILAAERLPKYFPMLMTAAGVVQPARVLVLGAGVAGLQAIATARRLGAVVEAFDVRRATKEQVESLGARFVELEGLDAEGEGGYARELTQEEQARLKALVAERTADADVVITTAQVPGRRAPVLVEEATVARMRAGSVIVDLAAASGGNCPLSKPDEEVVVHGVRILGPTNLPAAMPADASRLFARNVLAFVQPLIAEGSFSIPEGDEIYEATLLCANGAPKRREFFEEGA